MHALICGQQHDLYHHPAIETDVARGQPTFLGSLEHGLEMVILSQAIIGRIKQAVIAWDGVCVVTPYEGDQIDARANSMMFARPMPMHQSNLLRIGLVQGGIIDNQQAACPIEEMFGLLPQRRGIGFQPVEEPIERIVGRPLWAIRLHTRALRAGHHARCRQQEVDIVKIGHFRFIHRVMIPQVRPTA